MAGIPSRTNSHRQPASECQCTPRSQPAKGEPINAAAGLAAYKQAMAWLRCEFARLSSTRIGTRRGLRLPRAFKYLAAPVEPVKLLKVLDREEV
jgi:hypothetical protein